MVEIAQRYDLDRVYNGEISGWQSHKENERSEHQSDAGAFLDSRFGANRSGFAERYQSMLTTVVGLSANSTLMLNSTVLSAVMAVAEIFGCYLDSSPSATESGSRIENR